MKQNFQGPSKGGRQIIKAAGGGIMPLNAALGRQQALYDRNAGIYAGTGVITTPGYLLLVTLITGTTSQITFNTLENAGTTKFNIERRLKLNDTFTVTGMSFYVGSAATSSSSDLAKVKNYTYPNPVEFGAAVAANLEAIYNSYLTLRVDTTVFIDSLPMRTFYRVGQAQQGTGPAVVISRDEWDTAMWGRNEMTPSVELNGTATIEWQVQLPESIDLSATPPKVNYAMLYLTGFLNQGAAQVQRQFQSKLAKV